jgi:hypothetical protein
VCGVGVCVWCVVCVCVSSRVRSEVAALYITARSVALDCVSANTVHARSGGLMAWNVELELYSVKQKRIFLGHLLCGM